MNMAVAAKTCSFLVLLTLAAIATGRPQGKGDNAPQPRPQTKLSNCAHPKLLAGIEAAAATDLPDISYFIEAAKISGLFDIVWAYHRYTILAPTNEAFDSWARSMGLDSAQQLLMEEQKALLTDVVRLHFGVGGARYSKDLQEGSTTVLVFAPSASLEASTIDGQVTFKGPINKAGAVAPDVPLCNSVMHVVDTVILPADNEAILAQGVSKAAAGVAEL